MDNLTKEQRKRNMQNIKSKDTEIEVLLRKALWKRGYRFRKKTIRNFLENQILHLRNIKLRFSVMEYFFHGKDWEVLKPKLEKSNNSEYWINKIDRNRKRDHEIDQELLFLGWTVIRFWGKDIKKEFRRMCSSS